MKLKFCNEFGSFDGGDDDKQNGTGVCGDIQCVYDTWRFFSLERHRLTEFSATHTKLGSPRKKAQLHIGVVQ